MNIHDEGDLRGLKRKVSYLRYISTIFAEKDGGGEWNGPRRRRFERFKAILFRNWEALRLQLRDKGHLAPFKRMVRAVYKAVELVGIIQRQIAEAERRSALRGMFASLMQVDLGEGRVLN